jgi:alanine-synthesizing transaminase
VTDPLPDHSLVQSSQTLANVRYEIRGRLARRASELERLGYEILALNIGNPGHFGFRTPETMRLAIIENLRESEPYCPAKGIFPAREAVVMVHQNRGVLDVTADDVYMGNGVSELIDLTLRAMLNSGDEVLVPSPDYPLWTAAVNLNGGRAVHYPCRPENGFEPDPDDIAAMITPRTRAIVVINPNNPSGAVYSRATLKGIACLAERHGLVVMSDEVYDQITYDGAEFVPMATLVNDTLCATYSGLSKVYRACGYRVGWVTLSGKREEAQQYTSALETLASLRLCSNVPGQWAVQTALGGYQSIHDLTVPGGRLYESRRAVIESVAEREAFELVAPRGAMYAFLRVRESFAPGFDDEAFALALLEQRHVLLVPGSSFNFPRRDHLRITLLPDRDTLAEVFTRMDQVLAGWHR